MMMFPSFYMALTMVLKKLPFLTTVIVPKTLPKNIVLLLMTYVVALISNLWRQGRGIGGVNAWTTTTMQRQPLLGQKLHQRLHSQQCRSCWGSSINSIHCRNVGQRFNSIPRTRLFSTITQEETTEKTAFTDENDSIILEKFKSLSTEIRRHDDLYYNSESLDLSDDEFDVLVKEEEQLEVTYPHILKRWQTESGFGKAATRSGRVGISSTIQAESQSSTNQNRIQRRQHLHPMLSLDNVHNNEQLHAWLKRIRKNVVVNSAEDYTDDSIITILTEPKLDGLSLSLRYERQHQETSKEDNKKKHLYELVWASTRGNGKQGQDVTSAIQSMNRSVIPETFWMTTTNNNIDDLPDDDIIEVRGEVVMPQSIFRDLDSHLPARTNKNDTSIPTTFANARNAASGILMQKQKSEENNDDDEAIKKQENLRLLLQFYAYDVVTRNRPICDGLKARDFLTGWGFQVPMPITTTTLSIGNDHNTTSAAEINDDEIAPMVSYYQSLDRHRKNENPKKKDIADDYNWSDFEMDGCVHKLTNATLKQQLGNSMKSPKWAIAHKFQPQAGISTIQEIQIQVGRTGALTPVAVLEPIEVGGVVIQRATLHNFVHMKQTLLRSRKKLDEDDDDGHGVDDREQTSGTITTIPVGTSVLVRRAGDVIPQVVQRVFSSDDIVADISTTSGGKNTLLSLEPPTHCPACQSPVVWEETAATAKLSSFTVNGSNSTVATTARTPSIGQVVRCGGPPLSCPPRAITSLAHCYSRDALDIKGISEAKIGQLLDAKLIKFPGDIFDFDGNDWNTTSQLPGWGPKSCQNLRTTVEDVSSQGVSLGRYIYSLGIRHVGKHSSELVASTYGTVDAFLNALESASEWVAEEEDVDLSSRNGEPKDEGPVAASKDTVDNKPFPELQDALGIGPVLVNSLLCFSQSDEMVQAAKELARSIVVTKQPVNAPSTTEISVEAGDEGKNRVWEGFRVVITGAIPGMTRSEAQDAAKTILGAKSTPRSVSQSTDLLVYGDKVGKKKLGKAEELDVRTMPAEEFIQMLKVENS